MSDNKLIQRLYQPVLLLAGFLLLHQACADRAMKMERNAMPVAAAPAAASRGDAVAAAAAPDPRKIRRTGSVRIVVDDVRGTVGQIESLADRMGGFVSNSNVSGGRDQVGAGSITIRVPAESFAQAMGEIQKLGEKVLQAQTSAEDVTAQYVDLEARIKNLRVHEAQVQEIMRRSGTIDDTLRVAQQLSSVREQIEQLQGQLQLLSREVELATLSVELSAELPAVDSATERSGLGVTWRKSVRDMKEGFSGYAETMLAFLLRLPVVLLWIATVGLFVMLGWRLLRWFIRRLPESKTPPPTAK